MNFNRDPCNLFFYGFPFWKTYFRGYIIKYDLNRHTVLYILEVAFNDGGEHSRAYLQFVRTLALKLDLNGSILILTIKSFYISLLKSQEKTCVKVQCFDIFP